MPLTAVTKNFPSLQDSAVNTLTFEDAQQLSRILSQLNFSNEAARSQFPRELNLEVDNKTSSLRLAKAKEIYNSRQRRSRFFPSSMFGEPAWDILLVLYIHDGMNRLCIKDVGQLTDTPATTLLRWLKTLEDEQLISVRKHPLDRRVSILELTMMGRSSVAAYLDDTRNDQQR